MRAKHFITESGKIHPTMVAFLKQKGFTGPYLLRNLPKWYKEMFGNDKEYMHPDYGPMEIMFTTEAGGDPDYDAWVLNGLMIGYEYGQEHGSMNGPASKVKQWADELDREE
jgi:hypothetical protein